jgi:CBS domain-containing protein
MLIKHVMTPEPHRVNVGASAEEAALIMAAFGISSVPVLDRARPVGVVTDHDLAVRVLARGLDPERTPVSQVMNRDPKYVLDTEELQSAITAMHRLQVRRLLVCHEDGTLAGTLALSDLVPYIGDEELGETFRRVTERKWSARNGSPMAL